MAERTIETLRVLSMIHQGACRGERSMQVPLKNNDLFDDALAAR